MSDMKKYLNLFKEAEKYGSDEMDETEHENIESEEYVEVEDDFILPTHWGSALVDGDYSGVSDEEEEEINGFLQDFPLAHSIVGSPEELGFRRYNDANKMGGDVSLFKAYKRVKKSEATDELLEADLKIGVISNARQFKHHIAQNFDYYTKNIRALYPKDQKDTADVFKLFLKSQTEELAKIDLQELYNRLSGKIQDSGDAYDAMATFMEKIVQFFPKK